jgi:LPXTG-motif cell wall-anchored protein
MRAGLEKNLVRRALGALLLSAVLVVAGATSASAGGYGSDGDDCSGCPTPPPSTVPHHNPPTPTVPTSPHYGPSYPVPSVPPGTPNQPPPSSPPVLARTGSTTAPLVGIGLGAVAVGGGLVVFARKRRLVTVPA